MHAASLLHRAQPTGPLLLLLFALGEDDLGGYIENTLYVTTLFCV